MPGYAYQKNKHCPAFPTAPVATPDRVGLPGRWFRPSGNPVTGRLGAFRGEPYQLRQRAQIRSGYGSGDRRSDRWATVVSGLLLPDLLVVNELHGGRSTYWRHKPGRSAPPVYSPGALCTGTATSRGGCVCRAGPAAAIYGPTSFRQDRTVARGLPGRVRTWPAPGRAECRRRQVYAGMDIGTSKIKPQMRGFGHRLLDVAEPSSKLSLEAYAQMARDELASLAEDALPVLVGGTGGTYGSVLMAGPDRHACSSGLARRTPGAQRRQGRLHDLLARLAPRGGPACAPQQLRGNCGVADAWVSRVRPRGRVDREGNCGARRRRPCCRPSRSARPHLGVLETAAVLVPQTRRVAGRPSISGENLSVASAVTAPESEISLAQEQATTC